MNALIAATKKGIARYVLVSGKTLVTSSIANLKSAADQLTSPTNDGNHLSSMIWHDDLEPQLAIAIAIETLFVKSGGGDDDGATSENYVERVSRISLVDFYGTTLLDVHVSAAAPGQVVQRRRRRRNDTTTTPLTSLYHHRRRHHLDATLASACTSAILSDAATTTHNSSSVGVVGAAGRTLLVGNALEKVERLLELSKHRPPPIIEREELSTVSALLDDDNDEETSDSTRNSVVSMGGRAFG